MIEVIPSIFISYVRADKEAARNLFFKLKSVGFSPWMDTQSMCGGEDWKRTIKQAVKKAAFFLACLSSNSVMKRGIFQYEIKEGLECWKEKLEDDIYLIPVKLEDCKVPDSLGSFHWVNLYEPDGFEILLKALYKGLEKIGSINEITDFEYTNECETRDEFLSLCRKQVDKEIHTFVGSSFDVNRYIKRDFDAELSIAIDPWYAYVQEVNYSNTEANISHNLKNMLKDYVKSIRKSLSQDDFDKSYSLFKSFKQRCIQCGIFDLEKKREIDSLIDAIHEKGRYEIPNFFEQQLSQINRVFELTSVLKLLEFCYEGKFTEGIEILLEYLSQNETLLNVKTNDTDKSLDYKKAYIDAYDNKKWLTLQNLNSLYEISLRNIKTLFNPDIEFTGNKSESKDDYAFCSNCGFLYYKACKTIQYIKSRQIIIVADGGKGKTWTLSHQVLTLGHNSPILLFSAKNSTILHQEGLLYSIARTLTDLDDLRKPYSVQKLLTILRTILNENESLIVVIDGLDWRSDPRIIMDRLLQLRSEVEGLPIRLILSCRREYWHRIEYIYGDSSNHLLFSTMIHDFSDEEFKQVKPLIDEARDTLKFLSIDYRILRDPTVFGILLKITVGQPYEGATFSSTLDIYAIYLKQIIKEVSNRLGIELWKCDLTLKQLFRCILKASQGFYSRNPTMVSRHALQQQLVEVSCDYFPEVIEDFTTKGLLLAHEHSVWFASDLILEYGIAVEIVDKYWDDYTGTIRENFFSDFDLRKEWLPGKISIMAFTATLLTRKGYRLWDHINYTFESRADWFNQIILNIAPRMINRSFVEYQLIENATQLKHLKLEAIQIQLEHFKKNIALPEAFTKEEISKAIDRLMVSTQSNVQLSSQSDSQHIFRYFNTAKNFVDENLNYAGREASFWLSNFVRINVPLIANTEVPEETRLFLTNFSTKICVSPYVPLELSADIYWAVLSVVTKLNVAIKPEERMKVLISDDDEQVVDLIKTFINKYAEMQDISMNFIDISTVNYGDGIDTLKLISTNHYSVLLIDEKKPSLSGSDVIKRYRAMEKKGHHLQIIFFTGYLYDYEKSSSTGADVYVPKPFQFKPILRIIGGCGARDVIHLDALRKKLRKIIKKTRCHEISQTKQLPFLE